MTKTAKLIITIIFAAVIGFVFTACGNNDDSSNGDSVLSGSIAIYAYGGECTETELGTTLTAVYTGAEENVSFQWRRGSAVVGTEDTCIADIEGIYIVTVSAPGYKSKDSDPISVIDSGGGDVEIGNFFDITNITQFNNALSAIKNGYSGESYTLNIIGEITSITPQAMGSSSSCFGSVTDINVTLTGEGTLDTADENGSMFRIGDGQTLIIDGEDLILYGRKNGQRGHTGSNDVAVIEVEKDGILKIKNGIISGNFNSAVWVRKDGTFVMEGGEISNNDHAGVSIINGYFDMQGGKIINNTGVMGGGVLCRSDYQQVICTMTGGEISDNRIDGWGGNFGGGGVYLQTGTFILEGGKINNNSSGSDSRTRGGGVYIRSFGTEQFIMRGGEISGNSSAGYGGGVYLHESNGSKFIMEDGIVSANTASAGGGFYVGHNAALEKTNGIIYGQDAPEGLPNTASLGHAIYYSSGTPINNIAIDDTVTGTLP